ncbi:separase-like [Cicer arietinum]|uniref:separase n=1 Tax=Cicer arietinum TaxID=3827 RepID=A0A1S2YRL9_CICAR|nr:separase-like [Cicer arietinum]XP_012573582.1 separase-like [Cicer arietinum]XP_027192775.1 separase-like [Cicer arietinum]
MYLYMWHGCGSHLLAYDAIKKLEKCPAAFLMGCDSGAYVLNGSYAPICTPTSYLCAGSSFVVANLWTVTSCYVDKTIRTMFTDMLKARSDWSSKGKELEHKNYKSTIGAMVSIARNSHALLLGAGTVCFGLPTTICRKKNVASSNPNKRRKLY